MSESTIAVAYSDVTTGAKYSPSPVVASSNPTLANALEELGSAVSERRDRTLEKNKSTQTDKDRGQWLEQIEHYLAQVPDLEKQHKLIAFVSANLGKPATAQQFIRCLQQFSEDKGAQYIAGKALASSSNSADQRLFNQALEQFSRLHHQDIAITLNTSSVYAKHIPVEQIAQARKEYREIIAYESHSHVWRKLNQMAKQYGSVNAAIMCHQRALAADYSALKPSDGKAILGQVMHNLTQLMQLNTTYVLIEKMTKMFRHQFSKSLDPSQLMERILRFPDSQVVSKKIMASLMNQVGLSQPHTKVVAMQEIKKITLSLPDALYPSEVHRNRVLSSLQERIEEGINEEENWINDSARTN